MLPTRTQVVPEAHATFHNGKGNAPFRNKSNQHGGKQGPKRGISRNKQTKAGRQIIMINKRALKTMQMMLNSQTKVVFIVVP
jgi:hypothetical protein